MPHPAAPRSKKALRKMGERTVAMKWLAVVAALSIATVLDGISVSDLAKPVSDTSIEQAAITLPSDRCAPGCMIMMASNQPVGDRLQ